MLARYPSLTPTCDMGTPLPGVDSAPLPATALRASLPDPACAAESTPGSGVGITQTLADTDVVLTSRERPYPPEWPEVDRSSGSSGVVAAWP